jgi:probable HAF family extracellular repeat protein
MSSTHWAITDMGTVGGKKTDESSPVGITSSGLIVGESSSGYAQDRAVIWQSGRWRVLPGLGSLTYANAVNDAGLIVGVADTRANVEVPVAWRNGKLAKLAEPAGTAWGEAMAVSPSGRLIAGRGYRAKREHAYLWSAGRVRDLGPAISRAADPSPVIVGVTDAGLVVWNSATDNLTGQGRVQTTHVWIWQNGKARSLFPGPLDSEAEYVSPRGEVVGWHMVGPKEQHAFLWEDGHLTDLPGANAVASAINASGDIVGSAGSHAALWQNGRLRDLGTLGGSTSSAEAINDRGQIVGSSDTSYGDTHGFVWQDDQMTDLGTLGGPRGAINAQRSEAYAINPSGEIVGSSRTRAGFDHAVVWTP